MPVLPDENVPVDIIPVLQAAQIDAESVNFIGWKGTQNGELMLRARARFDLLLTRDKDFDHEFLRRYVTETFGIVLLAIPQQPGPEYAGVFARLWPLDARSFIGRVSRLAA
jgi:predicted nuclease of predicted toxin-antitoxin system